MKNKPFIIYSSSFILPVLILLICILILRIFPFGGNSFLYWDSEFQYINFYSYLKSTFFTNNNLFYSMSNLGGGNMLNFAAYYNFFSPFNLFFLIFPDELLNIALEYLMIIKIGLCGLTFSYFLNKEIKESYFSIVISLSYALSVYTLITVLSNFIYMDGIILLPLTVLGASKIVEKNDCKLYLITLFLTTMSNAYMGYVAVIFSVIYFFYKILAKKKNKIKLYLSNIKTLLFSTIISTILCAWFLLPVIYSLSDGKYQYFDIASRLFTIRVDFLELALKFYSNSLIPDSFWNEHTPYIFVGMLPVILAIFYFFNHRYSVREKVLNGCILIFLFSSCVFNFLFIIWTMGVEAPNGTMYRFSHIIVFFILFLAYKEIVKPDKVKKNNALYILSLFLIMSFAALCSNYKIYFNEGNFIPIMLDTIYAVLIICFLINFRKLKKNIKNAFIAIIIALHILNITVSTHYVYKSQKACCASPVITKFSQHKKSMKDALTTIYNLDNSTYRIASSETFIMNPYKKQYDNSPFLNSYDSISGYSSFGNNHVRLFYYYTGVPIFRYNFLISYNDNIQTLPASLFGLKYIISSNPKLHSPYQKIKTTPYNLNIYKNPYSFPLAFLIQDNKELKNNVKYNGHVDIPDFQNNILKYILNEDFGTIYRYKHVYPISKLVKDDYKKTRQFESFYSYNEKLNYNNNTYFLIDTLFTNLSLYLDKIKLNFNNKELEYIPNDLNNQIIYLDNKINDLSIKYIPGVLFYFDKKSYERFDNTHMFLIEENPDILRKYSEKANDNKCDIEKISSSHFKGKFKVKDGNNLLFLTIPYDEGWNIKINGKKRKPVKLFNCLMAIPVEENETELEMIYIPKGFISGLLISLTGLIILIFGFIINKRKKSVI